MKTSANIELNVPSDFISPFLLGNSLGLMNIRAKVRFDSTNVQNISKGFSYILYIKTKYKNGFKNIYVNFYLNKISTHPLITFTRKHRKEFSLEFSNTNKSYPLFKRNCAHSCCYCSFSFLSALLYQYDIRTENMYFDYVENPWTMTEKNDSNNETKQQKNYL